ncbi:flagellar hook assembly protein FlgD [Roseospira visakhapatnamensis]|uniref:Basal-body rod modification protein FlgD n=1 Tax=Roseospira visakhapatnamensis TaxID=390880 RepID=A0A7W6RBQ1_9PROT|nr:FlgD immunoglobulin-like domain containing protein [Roseospira visakhapatnamensis]MBB4265507.1 flagellar basal-body rod modification protein FlgD [Roseospira visakhapatnamensis]
MTIEATTLTSAYSSGISTTTAQSLSDLSENYDMFVQLLTTQLQNQNPLDPTDTDELTQQLMTQTQVEQQILSNQYLENLVLSTNNQAAQTAMGFVGMEITYDNSTQTYDGEESLSWSMDVPDDAESVTMEVKNADGLVIYRTTLTPEADGQMTFEWNGAATSGTAVAEGSYTLAATATLPNDGSETLDLETTAIVQEVDWSTGSPALVLANGRTTGLDSIISARQPTAAEA